jgi:hypothetical protein
MEFTYFLFPGYYNIISYKKNYKNLIMSELYIHEYYCQRRYLHESEYSDTIIDELK